MAEAEAAKEKESAPSTAGPSLFTRKGLIVLIILLAMEGGILFVAFKFMSAQKTEEEAPQEQNPFGPLEEIGEITLNINPSDSSQSGKMVAFKVLVKLDSSRDVEIKAKLTPDCKLILKDAIYNLVWERRDILSDMSINHKQVLADEIQILLNKTLNPGKDEQTLKTDIKQVILNPFTLVYQ